MMQKPLRVSVLRDKKKLFKAMSPIKALDPYFSQVKYNSFVYPKNKKWRLRAYYEHL